MHEPLRTKLMHAGRICLTDGSVLENRDICILNGFLIVSSDDPDSSPTWYNLNTVIRLENVTQPQPTQLQPIQRINYF